MRKGLQSIKRQFYHQQVVGIVIIVIVASIGTYFLVASHAATPYASSEAESGTLSSGATPVTDSNASNDTAVKFGTGTTTGTPGNCPGLPDGTAAFCDTFDNPTVNPAGSRSGQLNGTVWGVSEDDGAWTEPNSLNAIDDGIQTMPNCDSGIRNVTPPNEIEVCNGNLIEDINDGGGTDELAMYAKQPFNFAGRTGKVVFNVSNNSQGSHAAWPEFWMTDQPVPSPSLHEQSWTMLPRNGFVIRFAGCSNGSGAGVTCYSPDSCSSSTSLVGVDSVATIANYVSTDTFEGGNVDLDGSGAGICESQPGQQNHYEVDVSQNQITIYGTDAFNDGTYNPSADPNVLLATIQNANLNFTQGLIWLMDVHYNGDKFNNQRNNSFAWSDVGFDGPVEARDLTYDVPDNNTNAGTSVISLAYDVPVGGTSGPLTTESIPSSALTSEKSGDDKAYLLFAFHDSTGPEPYPLDFYVNNDTSQCISDNAWPYPSGFPGESDSTTNGTNVNSGLTIEEPLNLSCLESGPNTITFINAVNTDYEVYSVDVLLPGAAGVPNPNTPID